MKRMSSVASSRRYGLQHVGYPTHLHQMLEPLPAMHPSMFLTTDSTDPHAMEFHHCWVATTPRSLPTLDG
eukprot:CAMPEP_0194534054 /NCGR_PEP_ID=MMETSP0253-20130528/72083_2 /TAXON_ID=2966 /ORGANISM="Noctiluca scintillans" /LENGTH=69 /DNA_ID=CAMNT_0039379665 /DNA_START=170 /DNA_END=377 /DNA_ORIENTATION=-